MSAACQQHASSMPTLHASNSTSRLPQQKHGNGSGNPNCGSRVRCISAAAVALHRQPKRKSEAKLFWSLGKGCS